MYFSRKIIALLCLPFFASGLVYGQQKTIAVPLSITQVWQRAEVSNKLLKMKNRKVAGAEEAILDAKAERLPEVRVEGEYAKVTNMPIYNNGLLHTHDQGEVIHTTYTVGAEAYLNLYNGNKTNLKIKAQEEKRQLAQEQLNLSISEIKLRCAGFYLEMQRSIVFKTLLLKDISDQEKQLEEIRALLKNGVVLKSDVLRAELKLSRQKMSLLEIENDFTIANQKLAILLGEPDDFQIQPDPIGTADVKVKEYEDYLNDGMANSHELKISEQETELSKLELKNVKSNVSLKLGLFATYKYSYPQIQFYPYAISLYGLGLGGLKASFPVSEFYHNKHKTEEAKIALHYQELEHSATSDQVRQDVKEAYLRYKECLTRIKVAEENIRHAQENLRIINNTYFNQLSLLTDLLDADTQLLQTRFDLAASQIAAQLQYYKLQKATGEL
ncbi:TolC family protein [Pedobacter sp.]|uniref:TolC family protein n=1 Tax=Pedobacter sp. TaxID=1411316 RepID=UPI003D7F6B79